MMIPQSTIEPFGVIGFPQFRMIGDEFGTEAHRHHEAYSRIKATIDWWFWQHYIPNGAYDRKTLLAEREITRLGAKKAKWHTIDDGYKFAFTLNNWSYTLFYPPK